VCARARVRGGGRSTHVSNPASGCPGRDAVHNMGELVDCTVLGNQSGFSSAAHRPVRNVEHRLRDRHLGDTVGNRLPCRGRTGVPVHACVCVCVCVVVGGRGGCVCVGGGGTVERGESCCCVELYCAPAAKSVNV
jgi:hypothetical protein